MLRRRRDRCLRRDLGDGRHRALQREKKNAVSPRRGSEETPTRIGRHVFVTLVLENAGRSVHPGGQKRLPDILGPLAGVSRRPRRL